VSGTAELEAEALRIRLSAYAPYSGYRVGAALRTRSGRTFSGANVENASYGLTICAERVAVMEAVVAGHRELEAIAIATQSSPPAAPCGACRQVLREFASELRVICVNDQGERRELMLSALLPESFAPGSFTPPGGMKP
jgi:cytidine deaminase